VHNHRGVTGFSTDLALSSLIHVIEDKTITELRQAPTRVCPDHPVWQTRATFYPRESLVSVCAERATRY